MLIVHQFLSQQYKIFNLRQGLFWDFYIYIHTSFLYPYYIYNYDVVRV